MVEGNYFVLDVEKGRKIRGGCNIIEGKLKNFEEGIVNIVDIYW